MHSFLFIYDSGKNFAAIGIYLKLQRKQPVALPPHAFLQFNTPRALSPLEHPAADDGHVIQGQPLKS
jgi:hypothetical protein